MKRSGGTFSPNTSPVKKIDTPAMTMQQIQASLTALTAKINGIELAIQEIRNEFTTIRVIDNRVAALEKEIEFLHRQGLQKTVRISGLQDQEKESRDELALKIYHLFGELKQPQIQINMARRIGKPSTKPRPILIELFKLEDKYLLFNNKKAVKAKGIHIDQALTKAQAYIDKQLRDHFKLLKSADASLKGFTRNGRLNVISSSGNKTSYFINEQSQLQQI